MVTAQLAPLGSCHQHDASNGRLECLMILTKMGRFEYFM